METESVQKGGESEKHLFITSTVHVHGTQYRPDKVLRVVHMALPSLNTLMVS